jgi:hypothetical protein
MSLTEDQLRAALRDGEGGNVDADVLIASALRVRHERRHRINIGLAVAAAAVLIGGLGSVLVRSSHDEGGSSAGGAAAGSAASRPLHRSAAGGAGGLVPRPAASAPSALGADRASRACPRTPVHLSLPGGGGTGEFGSTGRLFSRDVAAITACGYPVSGARARTVIVGDTARRAARKLEAAPATSHSSAYHCPVQNSSGTVELLPVDARGRNLRPVVLTGACPYKATNGTAVRYPLVLPRALTAVLNGKPR